MVQPNMYNEAYQYIKTFRNQLVKEYGSEVTRHFWSKTYENSHMFKSNTSEMVIMEDNDELLISKLDKEKDAYSSVLVEGIEIVDKDLKEREDNTHFQHQVNQNQSQT